MTKKLSLAVVLRWIVEVGWALQILGFLFAVGTLVATSFGVRTPTMVPFPFELEPDVYEIGVGTLGEAGRIRAASGMLEIEEPVRSLELSLDTYAIVGMVLGLIMWYQLRNLCRSLAAGDPFADQNVRRIRIVAGPLIAWGLLQTVASVGWVAVLYGSLVTEGLSVRPQPDLDLGVLFGGLALLVLAEVFREGKEMRQEQSLTV